MARRVLAWECKYCGALKKSEKICKRHEIGCNKNPDRKNCLDCIHKCGNECSKRKIMCSKAVSAYCTDYEKDLFMLEE